MSLQRRLALLLVALATASCQAPGSIAFHSADTLSDGSQVDLVELANRVPPRELEPYLWVEADPAGNDFTTHPDFQNWVGLDFTRLRNPPGKGVQMFRLSRFHLNAPTSDAPSTAAPRLTLTVTLRNSMQFWSLTELFAKPGATLNRFRIGLMMYNLPDSQLDPGDELVDCYLLTSARIIGTERHTTANGIDEQSVSFTCEKLTFKYMGGDLTL